MNNPPFQQPLYIQPEEDDCPVCFGPISRVAGTPFQQRPFRMPCGHTIHNKCASRIILHAITRPGFVAQQSASCPVCRGQMGVFNFPNGVRFPNAGAVPIPVVPPPAPVAPVVVPPLPPPVVPPQPVVQQEPDEEEEEETVFEFVGRTLRRRIFGDNDDDRPADDEVTPPNYTESDNPGNFMLHNRAQRNIRPARYEMVRLPRRMPILERNADGFTYAETDWEWHINNVERWVELCPDVLYEMDAWWHHRENRGLEDFNISVIRLRELLNQVAMPAEAYARHILHVPLICYSRVHPDRSVHIRHKEASWLDALLWMVFNFVMLINTPVVFFDAAKIFGQGAMLYSVLTFLLYYYLCYLMLYGGREYVLRPSYGIVSVTAFVIWFLTMFYASFTMYEGGAGIFVPALVWGSWRVVYGVLPILL
jgi:hypothetical protein